MDDKKIKNAEAAIVDHISDQLLNAIESICKNIPQEHLNKWLILQGIIAFNCNVIVNFDYENAELIARRFSEILDSLITLSKTGKIKPQTMTTEKFH